MAPPNFEGVKKRTEAELENLVLVASPDFWTFRHLWNVSASVMLYISQYSEVPNRRADRNKRGGL